MINCEIANSPKPESVDFPDLEAMAFWGLSAILSGARNINHAIDRGISSPHVKHAWMDDGKKRMFRHIGHASVYQPTIDITEHNDINFAYLADVGVLVGERSLGYGTKLVEEILANTSEHNEIFGITSVDNIGMQRVCHKTGGNVLSGEENFLVINPHLLSSHSKQILASTDIGEITFESSCDDTRQIIRMNGSIVAVAISDAIRFGESRRLSASGSKWNSQTAVFLNENLPEKDIEKVIPAIYQLLGRDGYLNIMQVGNKVKKNVEYFNRPNSKVKPRTGIVGLYWNR